MLTEYHDNVDHPNYRPLMASLLKRYWWGNKMTLDCKLYFQHYVICNRAKPDRRGGASLHPLEILEYPWEIIGIDDVIDLPKSGIYGHTTAVIIMVCHTTVIIGLSLCSMPLGNQCRGVSKFIYR